MTKRVKIGYKTAREILSFYKQNSHWFNKNPYFDSLQRAISKVERESKYQDTKCTCKVCRKYVV